MIRSLTGKVSDILENLIILDVNGIGFEIICSRAVVNSCKIGQPTRIVTCLQFSESGAVIYGFASEREREFFLRLVSVKGVGGRSGIAILSQLSIDEVIIAVSSADVSAFMRVPGIGRKTAERLCFELKNVAALKSESVSQDHDTSSNSPDVAGSVIEALLSLGFTRSDAGGVINMIRAAQGEGFRDLDEENLLRLALRELHN